MTGVRCALILPLALAACMQAQPSDNDFPPGVLPGTPVMIDGVELIAEQWDDWPVMIAPVDPATGLMTPVQSGTGPTVTIGGSPDNRNRAIAALAVYCGRPIDPAGFDTQYVFQDPETGDWWFDGFCG